MDKMKQPTHWYVPGIVADVSERCLENGEDETAAVIDSMHFALREIHRLINVGPIINPASYREAGEIAKRFAWKGN